MSKLRIRLCPGHHINAGLALLGLPCLLTFRLEMVGSHVDYTGTFVRAKVQSQIIAVTIHTNVM